MKIFISGFVAGTLTGVRALQIHADNEGPVEAVKAVLFSPGAFSPLTNSHLELLVSAKEQINAGKFAFHNKTKFLVVGAYLSPVHEDYPKAGLLPAVARVKMAKEACEADGRNLFVSEWEANQPQYTLTHKVVDQFKNEHQDKQVLYTCGVDQFLTMFQLNAAGESIWSADAVKSISIGLIHRSIPT